MTDPLISALRSLAPGATYAIVGDQIVWDARNATSKPSASAIAAEIARQAQLKDKDAPDEETLARVALLLRQKESLNFLGYSTALVDEELATLSGKYGKK